MVGIDHLVQLVNHNKLLHIVNIVDLYNLHDNGKQLVVYMDHVHMNHQIVVMNQDHLFNHKIIFFSIKIFLYLDTCMVYKLVLNLI